MRISYETRAPRVLTLCFHGVGEPRRPLELGESHVWLAKDQYAEIIQAVSLHRQPVEITFDDSNESDFTDALPVLLKHGLRAEFFVIAGRIDTAGSLSRTQIRSLRDAGMAIGTHGMWHKPWRSVTSPEDMDEEIVQAARIIEAAAGSPIRHAACPNGSYDRRVLGALRQSGYERIYSVDGGASSSSSWLRSRYTVHAGDSGSSITALLDHPDGPAIERATRSAKQLVKRWR